jgi:hypothetical protein
MAKNIRIVDSSVDGRCLVIAVTTEDNTEDIIVDIYFPCMSVDLQYSVELGNCLGFIDRVMQPCDNNIIIGDFNFMCSEGNRGFSLCKPIFEKLNVVNCDDMLPGDNPVTYVSDSLHCSSFIDHCFVSHKLRQCVSAIAILDSGVNCSDHKPLSVSFKCSCPENLSRAVKNNPGRYIWRWDKANLTAYYEATRTNISAWRQSIITMTLDKCIDEFQLCDNVQHHALIDAYYKGLVTAVIAAAEKCIDRIPTHSLKPYWNDELNNLKQSAIMWHDMWVSAGKPNSGQLHHIKCSTKLKYKMAVKDAYTDFERRHDDELYFHFLHKRPTEFWKTWNAKFRRNINKNMVLDGCQTDEDIADKFATYFETIFQQPQVVDESTVQCEQLSTGNVSSAGRLTSSELCELISPELVEKCVSKIALGKACGPDNLSVEHVLYAHPSTIIALCRLFKLIILHKYVPTSFGAGTIVPLIKDKCGNLNDVSNYRPITLTPVLSKIFEHVFFSLCEEFLITDELQFGFKSDLGCADAIFALRTTIEHFNSKGSTVFLAALDIKKAFDSVKHDKLFNSLRSSGVPALIVDLLRNWYGKLYVNIRYNNGFSYCFSVLNGVRQGGVLSPSLFTLFVDAFISNLRMLNIGCRNKTTFIGCLLYADDILLLCPSIRGLQSMLNMCSDTASHISLEFNANKSYC